MNAPAGIPDPADVGTRSGAADDVSVTGPMPVVDLAAGHLHVSTRRDVTIVELDGGLDDDLASTLVPAIVTVIADASAVILDLDQTTLLDRTALEAVCAPLHAASPALDRCIVSGRLSARLVLERWDIPRGFVVFSSVPDALQARTFVESGYGTGWATAGDLST
ncbi:hypothetical protein [Actinospongicola halichondriae]|uniref:hypothetical protein n=1 Tax=Actinospongicola halichondriae TaxID=3236844 RepID=UPI003D468C4D